MIATLSLNHIHQYKIIGANDQSLRCAQVKKGESVETLKPCYSNTGHKTILGPKGTKHYAPECSVEILKPNYLIFFGRLSEFESYLVHLK